MPRCTAVSYVEQRYIHRVGRQLEGHPTSPSSWATENWFPKTISRCFLVFPWMGNPQPLWQPMPVLRHALCGKSVSWCLWGISWVTVCVPCLLSWHWAALKRACFHLLCTSFSCLNTFLRSPQAFSRPSSPEFHVGEPFFMWAILQSINHPHGPSLDSLFLCCAQVSLLRSTQSWTLDSSCGLTSAEQRGRITSLTCWQCFASWRPGHYWQQGNLIQLDMPQACSGVQGFVQWHIVVLWLALENSQNQFLYQLIRKVFQSPSLLFQNLICCSLTWCLEPIWMWVHRSGSKASCPWLLLGQVSLGPWRGWRHLKASLCFTWQCSWSSFSAFLDIYLKTWIRFLTSERLWSGSLLLWICCRFHDAQLC